MYYINYKCIILVHVIVDLVESLLHKYLYCEGVNSQAEEFVIGILEDPHYLATF